MAKQYKIKNQMSGKYLSTSSGTVGMEPFSGGINQIWGEEKHGDVMNLEVTLSGGPVYLHFLGLGLNVEVDSSRKSNINLIDAGSGTVYITDASSGYVLGQDGSNVVAMKKDASDDKKWVLENAPGPTPSELNKIKNQESGQYLSAFSGTVRMDPYSGGTNQKWTTEIAGDVRYLKVTVDGGPVYLHFLGLGLNVEVDSTRKSAINYIDAGSGTAYITDASSGYVLAQDGTGVIAMKKDASDAKKWVFERAN